MLEYRLPYNMLRPVEAYLVNIDSVESGRVNKAEKQ